MTQEEKELLLKDLCARLPYGVICQIYDHQQDYGEDIFDARLIHIDAWTSHCYFWGCSETDPYKIGQVKPYLRPMSSMTEEEKEELLLLMKEETKEMIELMRNDNFGVLKGKYHFNCLKELNWLLKNHFDFKGLIPKGLAIAVTEENNPYEN